ncbi:hypothetical protein OsI_25293 [Oryza sativa Indica Group]|uniref:Glycosyltransferase n=1 Tax=Oryza sativa subsp. indica TaxID=39946 RepID=A2YJ83_ORYSI|nr:hypothetical protein OsI_25293 [Oryza sativa Indica Group]
MAINGVAGAGAGDVDVDVDASAPPPPLHLVMFPWLAFGHLIPFLQLAKRLAARGHAAVTFLATPRNASRLAALPPELAAYVRVVSLPLPVVDGLPEGAESTADVPPEKVELLKKAFDGLAAPFAAFLADACAAGDREGRPDPFSRRPDWVVIDFAHGWLPPIADEHRVPCAFFSIYSAAALAFLGPKAAHDAHPRTEPEDFMSPPPWITFPSTIAFRRHEAAWVAAASYRPNASGVSDIDRMWQLHQRCHLIVYRSCPDVEGAQLCGLLDELYHKPVVPAGLLLPPDAAGDDDDGHRPDLMRWLDEQPARSVVYVALGTEAPVTADNVRELALGLELAGARFLWALRDAGERLPEGYKARVAGRSVVEAGWVPQVRVLAHAAVGAFLTHCGWGSTVESLRFGGLPLVMLPFIADQGLIARAMADRGLGVEVARDDDGDGSFRGEDVAAAVRRVMAEEEGKVFARNAREMQEALGDGERQDRYVDELAERLRRRRSLS